MRILLLAVGRMKRGPERELLSRYTERSRLLVRGVGLTGFETREIEESRARHPDDRRREEAKALDAERAAGARVAVLDERGRPLGSQAFADDIARARDSGAPDYAVVIGGPDGLAEPLRTGAHLSIAYGAATFPHQIVRILAAEQIYRALTILGGHPYHRP